MSWNRVGPGLGMYEQGEVSRNGKGQVGAGCDKLEQG